MFVYVIGGAIALGVLYAVKHHITVAQAKAEAEAIVAKVKAEVAVAEADATAVVAKIKAIFAAVK